MHLKKIKNAIFTTCACALLLSLAPQLKAQAPSKTGQNFKKHVINADSRFEAAAILDVNNDGKLDLFCGGFWYEAPNWKKHVVREVPEKSEYYYDFANLPLDVDHDGFTDIVNAAWHDKTLFWLKNPGKTGALWEYIKIDEPGNMETALLVDISGDGQPDILPNAVHSAAWYEYSLAPSAPYGHTWIKHELPPESSDHGIGYGDIDSDGLMDIIAPKGWLQQKKGKTNSWNWLPEFDLGKTSVPILVYDVDRDKDSDIIWGLGHDYGIYWLEQTKDADGKRAWERHLIDDSWSQPHFLLLANLDEDPALELITGKRYRAHNGKDPGGSDPRCIYYYDINAKKKTFTRHLISEGGAAGFGINTMTADIDGDGDQDLLAPGKSGLYLFENLLEKKK